MGVLLIVIRLERTAIDRAAGRAGTTRSGFLTRAALTVIKQNIKLA